MITGIVHEAEKRIKKPAVTPGVRVRRFRPEAPASFLYIGKRKKRTTKCLSFFTSRSFASNYTEAKNILLTLSASPSRPGFIIVDMPLNAHEFSNFVYWVRSNQWSFMIPVIYNETILNESELKKLTELNIADDIVNIEEYCTHLSSKASLFRESKIQKRETETYTDDDAQVSKEKTPLSKRVFDILIASILLIAGIPLFLLIALIIKLESRGPVIYKSKRAGRGFKIFNFFKFRTMIQGADKIIDMYADLNSYGHSATKSQFVKIKHDPRVTRFGRFLRKTSLDELPQLVNVLKGDMSIVGNRPLPLYEASVLTTDDDSERFMAPAGITGLWQVSKRGRENMNAEERISLDIEYSRKQGFVTDCRILLKTPFALLQKSDV